MKGKIDITLIHPPYHRRRGSGQVFPIGLGYLASAVEGRGYTANIIDCALHFDSLQGNSLLALREWLSSKLKQNPPRLAIGIGPCTTSAVKGIYTVAEICKTVLPDIPLLFGGPLASIPGQLPIFFDAFGATAVIPGDGEKVLCNVLETLEKQGKLESLKEITTSTANEALPNIVHDLDSISFPKRPSNVQGDSYYLSVRRDLFSGPYATIITSRGCPHRCSFCTSIYLRGGLYSKRTLANVMSEIRHLRQTYRVESLVFYDDTLFQDSTSLDTEVAELGNYLSEFNGSIIWQAEIRPDTLVKIDEQRAINLFNAGCRQLNIGIEKGNMASANLLGKPIDTDKILRAANAIKAGSPQMRLTATFILGGPGETSETVEETIRFSTELGLLYAHYYPMEVYQGTGVYKECFPNDGPVDWYHRIMKDPLPWGEVIFESPEFTKHQLLHLVSDAYRSFYDRDEWHNLARDFLGTNYHNVVSIVNEWCHDRFSFGKEPA